MGFRWEDETDKQRRDRVNESHAKARRWKEARRKYGRDKNEEKHKELSRKKRSK